MKCARCLEDITMPYWFEGKPFGYTCIKIVNPLAKKKKAATKEHWVEAQSHNFNPKLDKQHVTAYTVGKRKTTFLVIKDRQHNRHVTLTANVQLGLDNKIFLNIMVFKSYSDIKDEIETQNNITGTNI